MPGLGGRFWKNCSRDSRPPADAPMPTTRNLTGSVSGCLDVETDSELTEVSSSFPSTQMAPRCGASSFSPNTQPSVRWRTYGKPSPQIPGLIRSRGLLNDVKRRCRTSQVVAYYLWPDNFFLD